MRGMRTPTLVIVLTFTAACGDKGGGAAAGASGSSAAQAAPSAPPAKTAPAAAEATNTAAQAAPSGAPAAAAAPSSEPAAPASAEAKSPPPAADPGLLKVEGKAIQGGVLKATAKGKIKKIGFPGHKTTILEDGEFLIAFGRNANAKEKLTLTFDDGSVLEREFDVEQREYKEDRIDGLPKKMVDLDAETKKKVSKAEAKIDERRKKFSMGSCYKEKFIWPLKGKITSRYGQPRILNGQDAGPHWGVDIAVPLGTKVKAPACGKIIFAEKDVPLAGHTIVIDHGRGLSSTLIHLDKFHVKEGEEVKQGDVIATVGLTGRTNGPHLDWRMNLYDIRTDPELLVPRMK
jgi:murein DD-endopeptidase MepM/ murein hydrolase activator NlpD